MTRSTQPQTTNAERAYHHGSLVEALIAAAVDLIAAEGVEALSLRDVSKRVGVSPGAPFRHFKNKTQLLTAVAEQSMSRLTQAIELAHGACKDVDPIARLTAVGHGYLNWALGNPTHFQVISSRTLIDFSGSTLLVEQNEAIRELMLAIVAEGQAAGRIRCDATSHDIVVSARAFGYGLARMAVDGHFPEWHVTGDPRQAAEHALDLYIAMLQPARGA
jgi:AcrR family transcriptional regulator